MSWTTVAWIAGIGVALGAVCGFVWRLRSRPLCKLVLCEGSKLGVEFVIRSRVATIGREEGQTVAVSHPKVSAEHAVLELDSGDFVLRNRSKRGVRVNGEPVEEAVLRSGDLIRLADAVDLIFTRL